VQERWYEKLHEWEKALSAYERQHEKNPDDTNYLYGRMRCLEALGEWWVILSLHFNGHFPGEPGLADVYWSKRWWKWWWQLDYWSYKSCKAPVKSSPPTNQHPVFSIPDALPVAQPTVSKHWREKCHIPWTCLPQDLLLFCYYFRFQFRWPIFHKMSPVSPGTSKVLRIRNLENASARFFTVQGPNSQNVLRIS